MPLYEKEIIDFLELPSIPKKEHDGETPFDKGVAVIELLYGNREAYAVCTFNPELGHSKPHVVKVFSSEPFKENIKRVYVVPSYMSKMEEIPTMDLDDVSKKKVEQILKEAKDIENEGVENKTVSMDKLTEWIFPEITNKEEAQAWIRRYNSTNKIKGKIPSNEETLKLRLYSIYVGKVEKQKK